MKQAPDRLEYIKQEWFEIKHGYSCIEIYVKEIDWTGPYSQNTKWIPVATMPANATYDQICAKVNKIINAGKYFQLCTSCGTTQPFSCLDNGICYSCMEISGIVF